MVDKSITYSVLVSGKTWLNRHTFELRLQKPTAYCFRAGQKILCLHGLFSREYSLVSSPDDDELAICVKQVPDGVFSNYLAGVTVGDALVISNAYGFFCYQEGRSVFVATGTGIAPFVAFARSGVRDFILLHGVSSPQDLYYRQFLTEATKDYVPCLSSGAGEKWRGQYFHGRVTEYLANRLGAGTYTFYLCGQGQMIRDAVVIIDRKFQESRVFSECFFG